MGIMATIKNEVCVGYVGGNVRKGFLGLGLGMNKNLLWLLMMSRKASLEKVAKLLWKNWKIRNNVKEKWHPGSDHTWLNKYSIFFVILQTFVFSSLYYFLRITLRDLLVREPVLCSVGFAATGGERSKWTVQVRSISRPDGAGRNKFKAVYLLHEALSHVFWSWITLFR